MTVDVSHFLTLVRDCMPELINYIYDDTITIYYTVPNFMYFMSFMYFYENCNHCKIVL